MKLENFHYFQKKSINDDFFQKIKNINDKIFAFPFLFFGSQDAKKLPHKRISIPKDSKN
jgi:hypothetical protein